MPNWAAVAPLCASNGSNAVGDGLLVTAVVCYAELCGLMCGM